MPARLLALQADDAPLGLLAEACAARGLPVSARRLGTDEPLPAGDHDALLLVGLDGHADAPAVAPALEVIRDFAGRGRAVLGLGLGAQLVALALGGGVTRGAAPQYGMIDVEALPAAQADPLTRAAGGGLPLLHWHEDLIRLPPGAELLLRCE